MAYCLIHGRNRGDPSRGDSSHSRPPRTIHEALSGFEARGRSTVMLRSETQEEKDALQGVLDAIPQSRCEVRTCALAWTGSDRNWGSLYSEMMIEAQDLRGWSSSSSSSSSSLSDYLPPAADASRRSAAFGRADRAGGYQSDMSTSQYTSEPMTSDTGSSAMVPYNIYSSRRDTGGNRNHGRTARDQGGRNGGDSRAGHGIFRLQGGRNAGHPPSNPRGPHTSRGPDATHSRVQSWVHETSRHHNAENPRADSGSPNAGASASSRSRRGYAGASTQTW